MAGGALLVHGFSRAEIVANLPAILGRRADSIVLCPAPNGIVALASPLGCDDPDQAFDTSEAVTALALDHARILAGLAAVSDVVPLRLGTIVSGAKALAALCNGQASTMRDVLEAIRGRVEFGVRVLLRPDEPTAPAEAASSGRSYLRARAGERSAKRLASERQHDFYHGLAEHLRTLGEVRSLAPDAARAAAGRIGDLACLVERERGEDFAGDLARRAEDARSIGLDIVVTGPWPAYSFVAAEPASEAH